MQTLAASVAADAFAAKLQKDRAVLTVEVEQAGGPESWWRSRGLGDPPPELTLEAILSETAGFWSWASERAVQCARCPAHGGACASPAEVMRGQLLAWEAGPVAQRCPRWKEWVLRDWLSRSGVDPLFLGLRLEDFRLSSLSAHATLEAFWDTALSPAGDAWLVIAGPHQSGKTHLAVSIICEIKRRRLHKSCWYVSMHTLPRLLKVYYKDESLSDPFDHVRSADVVVIDHLNAKQPPWLREALEEVLVGRWQAQRSTLITTLDSAAQLAQTFPALTGLEQKIAEIQLAK